jgi:membrane protein required for colicin V production
MPAYTTMLVDIIFIILIVMAIFKGYSRGFIVAVFSFFAFIIGLAAALKLSAVVANYLSQKMSVNSYLLPVISFALVFIAVVFIVRWVAAVIKKVARLAFLGWVDAFAGITLYAIMYIMIYSVVLFYATKIHLVSDEVQSTSITYGVVAPLAPKVIELLGGIFPFFSNMFKDLSAFFESVSQKASR